MTIEAVVRHDERMQDIAKDVVEHFEARQKVFEGKTMIGKRAYEKRKNKCPLDIVPV